MNSQATSLQSYRSIKRDGLQQRHYGIITSALEKIGEGNATAIADACSLNKYQVGKRTGDMRKLGLLVDTGTVAKSDAGRASVVYRLPKKEN